jgi:hypothetical protein
MEEWVFPNIPTFQHSTIPFHRSSWCIDHNEELSFFVAEITKFVCDA